MYLRKRISHEIVGYNFYLVVLVCLYLLFNLFFLAKLGIAEGGDTARYILGADNLIQAKPLTGKQPSYLGYIAFIALAKYFHADLTSVVIAQIILATLALLALYDLGKKLSDSKLVGILCAAFYTFNYDILRWNRFILTDSLYISFVIISVWSIYQAYQQKNYLISFLTIFFLIFTASIRPTGWILLPCAFTWWIGTLQSSKFKIGIIITLMLGTFTGLMLWTPYFKTGIQNESLLLSFENGVVVWGYNPWNIPIKYKFTDFTFQNIIRGNITWIVYLDALWQVMRLWAFRLLAYFGHIRPFYSIYHNVLVALFLGIVYPLTFKGIMHTRYHKLTHLVIITILGHVLVLLLTFADWDGRFLLYILPLCFIFAGYQTKRLANHKNCKKVIIYLLKKLTPLTLLRAPQLGDYLQNLRKFC